MTRPDAEPLERLRAICLALPEVTERLSHGAPTWFVRGKRTFVTLWAQGHHGDQFPHLWCAAPPGAQADVVESEPERFFRPPYVGGRGWLGVRLDVAVDWGRVRSDLHRCLSGGGSRHVGPGARSGAVAGGRRPRLVA
jgi:hypothetical protein